YCEERPLLVGNPGMGAGLCTYSQSSLETNIRASKKTRTLSLDGLKRLSQGRKIGKNAQPVKKNMMKSVLELDRRFSADYTPIVKRRKGRGGQVILQLKTNPAVP
ncbi:hypothetical protein Tco_1147837, partial [Tanacetum coccineum]